MTRKTDQIQRWKKVGGGSLRFRNRIIKPGEIVELRESEIPIAFVDLFQSLGDAGGNTDKGPEEKVASVFSASHRGGGRWNVLDQDDKVMNEEFLTKVEALELIEKLS